jgi:isoquinoline 1-oxidoreductase beta subunit
VPNVQAEACEAVSHVRTGWLRAVYNLFHAFAVNSFLDEIAHARKEDPRNVMLEVYGPARNLSLKDLGIAALSNYGGSLEEYPVDAGRLRGVIERVTKNADWDKRNDKKGRALGLAAHRSFLSYVAVVAAVSQQDGEYTEVDEVWIVADCGIVVNVDRVIAQMQGAVLNGLNHALHGGVTYKQGAVEQSNFDGVQLLRMGSEPIVHVEILKSKEPPGGCGEPGVPPVAPAVANAIFALTGKRHRAMPFV